MIRQVGPGPISRLLSTALSWVSGDLVPQANMPVGVCVQRSVATPYTSNSDITASIPLDDTVPHDSEGTQILTVTHAMLATGNRIKIGVGGMWSAGNTAVTMAVSIISSTATLGIYASAQVADANAELRQFFMQHEYAPGATGSITYSVRAGISGGSTIRMNGLPTARRFGGVSAWHLIVEESKG